MSAINSTGEASEVIRVLVADDPALLRRGVRAVLDAEVGIEVVGEAVNGGEAVEKARQLTPDVVLMDVRMPHVNGIDAARRIRAEVPSTKIVMLTVSDHEEDLYEAIKAGANGYLLKEIPGEQVADVVRAVMSGQSFISPSMASKLLNEFNALAARAHEHPQQAPALLTTREIDVLRLVAEGMSTREISDQLYIAANTVKNHVRNILEKLHLHSRTEAVTYARRERLLDTIED